MTNRYSKHSLHERQSLHPILRDALDRMLPLHDFRIVQGGRTEDEQWAAFNRGDSTLRPPQGKHLLRADGLAYAADLHPFINGVPIDTSPEGLKRPVVAAQFGYFIGLLGELVRQEAEQWAIRTGQHYKFRSGADWDMDGELYTDQKFNDPWHVELVWRKL